MVYQHPQLKFVVCRQVTHYDSIQKFYTIVSMFYPSQSFDYQSRSISSYLCMISLLGLNYVKSDHDIVSPRTNTYPLQFLTEVLIFLVLQLVSSLQNKLLIFHTDFSLSIRINFQHSLSEQIHNSFIHIAISLPLFSLL